MADESGKKFHCLRAAIDGGYIANMNRLDLAVYMTIYHHADGNSCLVSAGAHRIAWDAGERNVGRTRASLKSLEQLGLLEVVSPGGGRMNPTIRRLLTPPPLPHWVPFGQAWLPGQTESKAGPETGTPHVLLFDGLGDGRNPDNSGAQRGTISPPKQGQIPAETGTPHVPRSRLITEYHQHHGAETPAAAVVDGGGGDLKITVTRASPPASPPAALR